MAAPSVRDCVTPAGLIDCADFWPQLSEKKAKERIQGFIEQGTAKAVDITDAAKNKEANLQWVYYRSAGEAFLRLSLNAASEDARDEGSHSYLAQQIQNMKDMRDEALAAFEDLVDEVVNADAVVGMPRTSRSVRADFEIV